MADFPKINAECPEGGQCEVYSRDAYLGSAGVVQCRKCSQVYAATGWQPRVCQHCEKPYGQSLHDPCIGELPPHPEHGRVTMACCGHGDDDKAYVAYEDTTRIWGPIDGSVTRR